MSEATVMELYERHIRALSVDQRLRLAALIVGDLADEEAGKDESPPLSIEELYGLGRSNPVPMDAQEYVNKLRDEWDERPW